MMSLLRYVPLLLLFPTLAMAQLAGRYHPHSYQPKQLATAENHLQQEFLRPERAWERIDIYVPKEVGGERLPTIVLFYGGGWGGKNMGGVAREIEPLIEKGYVVAVPDYVLGASQPVPLAVWDGANAIRYLRANAEKYRIDPERIGVWGFSAGGWLVQNLGPADASTLAQVRAEDKDGQRQSYAIPMLEPRPLYPDQSAEVQAIVTDWGAGHLKGKHIHSQSPPFLTSDDPPLLTCHNIPGEIPEGPELYRAAGAPVEVAPIEARSTHVPDTQSPAFDKRGDRVTWRERIHQFFDEYVKHPANSTPPEAFPSGGPATGATRVTLRSIHPDAAIYYTLNGNPPSPKSQRYQVPVRVEVGHKLKAIAVKPGLQPSRITAVMFRPTDKEPPRIDIRKTDFTAEVGKPFEATFSATGDGPQSWIAAGKLGNIDPEVSKHREVPWLSIDPETGILSGTPKRAGVYPLIVAVNEHDGEQRLTDARTVIVTVQE